MFSITAFTPALGQDVAEGDNIMTEEQVIEYVATNGKVLESIHILNRIQHLYKNHVGFFAVTNGKESPYRMALGKQELVWKI